MINAAMLHAYAFIQPEMMKLPSVVVLALAPILLSVSALPKDDFVQPRAGCTVTSYSEVADALASCSDIIIDGISVPGGETLTLQLQQGAKLTFRGTTTFGYKAWTGPLLLIHGDQITVEGAPGSLLDGQGPLYWDGKGSGGTTKPKFIRIEATGGSEVNNINVLNCPVHCITIADSDALTLSGWNVDVSAGDAGGGHNTDGFDVSSSTNVVIKDSVVFNQDDCVALNQGSGFVISGLYCSGSHGLSLSVGFSTTSVEANTLTDVLIVNSTVVNADNGIHVKTHTSAGPGAIRDVTYKDIILAGIRKYGINIQEDYDNGGSTGTAVGNIPISNLQMVNIRGSLAPGSNGVPVYIFCGDRGCDDWEWSDVSISGGGKSNECNFTPRGFSC